MKTKKYPVWSRPFGYCPKCADFSYGECRLVNKGAEDLCTSFVCEEEMKRLFHIPTHQEKYTYWFKVSDKPNRQAVRVKRDDWCKLVVLWVDGVRVFINATLYFDFVDRFPANRYFYVNLVYQKKSRRRK